MSQTQSMTASFLTLLATLILIIDKIPSSSQIPMKGLGSSIGEASVDRGTEGRINNATNNAWKGKDKNSEFITTLPAFVNKTLDFICKKYDVASPGRVMLHRIYHVCLRCP